MTDDTNKYFLKTLYSIVLFIQVPEKEKFVFVSFVLKSKGVNDRFI